MYLSHMNKTRCDLLFPPWTEVSKKINMIAIVKFLFNFLCKSYNYVCIVCINHLKYTSFICFLSHHFVRDIRKGHHAKNTVAIRLNYGV